MDLKSFSLYIFDLDGCLWENNRALESSKDILVKLTGMNKSIAFLSNNSTRPLQEYQEKIQSILEYDVREDQIVSSALLAANYATENEFSKVFMIGEKGLHYYLERENIEVFESINNQKDLSDFDAVIVGMDRDFTYQKLDQAQDIIVQGAEYVGTNIDPDFPLGNKIAPGGGSMIAAVSTAAGREPDIVVGKPNGYSVNYVLKNYEVQKNEAVIIGDRLITDVKAGINAGISSILVLTGRGRADYQRFKDKIKPDAVFNNIKGIYDNI